MGRSGMSVWHFVAAGLLVQVGLAEVVHAFLEWHVKHALLYQSCCCCCGRFTSLIVNGPAWHYNSSTGVMSQQRLPVDVLHISQLKRIPHIY